MPCSAAACSHELFDARSVCKCFLAHFVRQLSRGREHESSCQIPVVSFVLGQVSNSSLQHGTKNLKRAADPKRSQFTVVMERLGRSHKNKTTKKEKHKRVEHTFGSNSPHAFPVLVSESAFETSAASDS